MKKRALLVIDLQKGFIGKEHVSYFNYDEALIERVNQRINEYEKENVIYIANLMKHNLINRFAPFHCYEGSNEAELASELHIVNEQLIKKYKGDAFSNQGLSYLLKQKGIKEIELVGIDGCGCVAMTALGGVKNGYTVVMYEDGIATRMEKKKEKVKQKLVKKGVKFI